MTKKIIFFGVIAVAIIGFFAYRWYKYSQCKADAGKPCTATLRTATDSGIVVITTLPTGKTTKCNFWTGKTCS